MVDTNVAYVQQCLYKQNIAYGMLTSQGKRNV